jgi:DNA mismatch endonuclease, patch repair protein
LADKKKNYRDHTAASPLTLQEKISRYMRGNKSRDTKPELKLRKALWQAGLRGYRIHWEKAPGKPDICYPSRKIAIFVHGCFWHRCPTCQPAFPKTNTSFWANKFEKNLIRDAKYKQQYREAGWQRLVIWECQLKENLAGNLAVIKELHRGVPDSIKLAA